MSQNYKAELVGAFGQPIAENPTGVMQEAGFNALGLNWRYLMLEVSAHDLAVAVAGARAFGMRGFNLTIPHKVAVIPYLDDISPEVKIIGAVNTVRRDGDRLIGENTDGKGFLRALTQDYGMDPRGKAVVMVGAGGAARAIATELALAGIERLHIVNRTEARVLGVVNDLRQHTPAQVTYELWEQTYTVPSGVDIFINATSIGLHPHGDAMPDVDLRGASKSMLVTDVVFNPVETRLLQEAKGLGLATLDGLSMLVHQGVFAFELWTGEQAPIAVMKQALYDALNPSN